MTSATEETSPTPHGNGRAHERSARHAGAWVETLRRSDVSRLWTELQRLVVNHPLVRASYSAGLLVEEGDRVYGLREWRADKQRRAQAELEERVQMIPVRQRDTRMVGCTGDAQIIISNSDLEDLIVSVLEACDSPVDVRSLRSLVMSRLPVMDIYLVPIGGGDDEEGRGFEPVDGHENPEQWTPSSTHAPTCPVGGAIRTPTPQPPQDFASGAGGDCDAEAPARHRAERPACTLGDV